MNPETVLQIIRLSLEITIKVIDSIPLEQRQAMAKQMWEDHQKTMAFWRGIYEVVSQ